MYLASFLFAARSVLGFVSTDFYSPQFLSLFGGVIKFAGKGLSAVGDVLVDFASDPVGFVNQLLVQLIDTVASGVLDILGIVISTGIKYFLFYKNPMTINALDKFYFEKSLPLFAFIVMAMFIAYYPVMMLLADEEQADIQRMVERLILAGIYVFIGRHVIAFFASFTNALAFFIYPDSYTFEVGIELLSTLLSGVGSAVAVAALYFGPTLVSSFGSTIAFMLILMFLIFAIRMMIIYITYALYPVIMGFWVVDIGPAKYGKLLGDMLIKLTAGMMVAGIIVAAVINVGASVADRNAVASMQNPNPSLASNYDTLQDESDTNVFAIGPNSPVVSPEVEADGQFYPGENVINQFGNVVIALWVYVGVLLLSMTTIVSIGGVVFSAGSNSPGGTGGMYGRDPSQHHSGSGSGMGFGSHSTQKGGVWAEQREDGTTGSMYTQELDDGSVVITNPAGAGMIMNPNQNNPKGQNYIPFEPEDNPLASEDAPPNPFNNQGAPTLGDKASNVVGGAKDRVFSMTGFAGETIEEGVEIADEKAEDRDIEGTFDELGDTVSGARNGVSDAAHLLRATSSDAKQKANDKLEGTRPGKALGVMGGGLKFAASRGKAYGSAFKQPSGVSMMDELESVWDGDRAISKPNKDTPRELAHGAEAFDIGIRNSEQGDTYDVGGDGDDFLDLDESEYDDLSPEEFGQAFGGAHGIEASRTFRGRGPDIDSHINVEDDEFGPTPDVNTFGDIDNSMIARSGEQIAQELGDIESYSDISTREVMNQMESMKQRLNSFESIDISVQDSFSEREIQDMLEHHAQTGVDPQVAIKRIAESQLNPAAGTIGDLHVDGNVLDEFGVGDIPGSVATDAPVRRMNLGKEGYMGDRVDDIWRVERNDGSTVYQRELDATDMTEGLNAIRTEELLDKAGVRTPDHHLDPVNGVLRTEGVDGFTLNEVANGESDFGPGVVDRDELVDSLAGMGITGQHDVHGTNLKIDSAGNVTPVGHTSADGDVADTRPGVLDRGPELAERLGYDVDEEELAGRMQELSEEVVDRDVDPSKKLSSKVDLVGEDDTLSGRVGSRLPDDSDPDPAVVDSTTDASQIESTNTSVDRASFQGSREASEHEQSLEKVADGETSWQRDIEQQRQSTTTSSGTESSRSTDDSSTRDSDSGASKDSGSQSGTRSSTSTDPPVDVDDEDISGGPASDFTEDSYDHTPDDDDISPPSDIEDIEDVSGGPASDFTQDSIDDINEDIDDLTDDL